MAAFDDGYVWLSNAMQQLLRNMAPDEAQIVLTKFYHTIKALRAPLLKAPSGPKRARAIYAVADELIKQMKAKRSDLSCKAGCHKCCSIYVSITDDEADLLAEVVRERELPIDLARLELQAQWGEEDYALASFEEARCVFLGGDGLCTIYADRPLSCRNFHVVSPPANCDPRPHIAPVSQAFDYQMEMFWAAASNLEFSKDDRKTSLPNRLLRRLENERRGHEEGAEGADRAAREA